MPEVQTTEELLEAARSRGRECGTTVREDFARAAMQGQLAAVHDLHLTVSDKLHIAEQAVHLADILLLELAR